MNLIIFAALKFAKGPVFIDDLLNSNEDVRHSKTNLVKIAQNHMLFRKLINAVRKVISQNWHVTYSESETTNYKH